jgi:hypothetical protein
MTLKPFRRALGVLLLVDGALAFVSPDKYPRVFQIGSPLIDDILDYLSENPTLTRRLSLGEIAAGLWLTFG